MKYVNIVFEYDYNDVDIIAVPDWICGVITDLSQQFCDWLGRTAFFTEEMPDGRQVTVCETEGFVYWLNEQVLSESEEKAFILKEHTTFCKDYYTVDF